MCKQQSQGEARWHSKNLVEWRQEMNFTISFAVLVFYRAIYFNSSQPNKNLDECLF